MIYDYMNDGGGRIARNYPMGEAPSEFYIDGVLYYRDYSTIQWTPVIKDKPFVSYSAPLRGGRFDDPNNPAPNYLPDGVTPAFNSTREAREWAKRGETEHGSYVLDP